MRLHELSLSLLTASVFYAAAQYYIRMGDERMWDYATQHANAEYVRALRMTNPSGVVH